MLVLIDWEGRIRSRFDENGNLLGVYNSLELVELKDMVDDIKVLKAELEKDRARKEYQEEKKNKESKRNR
jgi:protein SCO1